MVRDTDIHAQSRLNFQKWLFFEYHAIEHVKLQIAPVIIKTNVNHAARGISACL